jgi:hypothetical protein
MNCTIDFLCAVTKGCYKSVVSPQQHFGRLNKGPRAHGEEMELLDFNLFMMNTRGACAEISMYRLITEPL